MRRLHRQYRLLCALLVTLPALLAGCDLLGIEGAGAVAARREAEGKAIGGACRHAARSIEQCYAANKKADKASVFTGWREMNDYMRENKIEAMPSSDPPPAAAAAAEESEGAPEAAAGASAKKPSGKAEAGKDARAKPATSARQPH